MSATARSRYSSLDAIVEQAASAARPSPSPGQRWRSRSCLALDRGRIESTTVGVAGEEYRQRSDGVGSVFRLGKALLAEAIVDPVLHRSHLALGYPVPRPG